MTLTNLTPQQLQQLSNYVGMVRGASYAMTNLIALIRQIDAQGGSISSIVGTPTGTQLPVTKQPGPPMPSITDTQLLTLTALFQEVLSAYGDAAHQQQLSAAIPSGRPSASK